MAYFHVSSGLRGAYLADNAAVIRCNTRRELKDYIASEARNWADAGYIGANKKDIAHIAAIAWRNRNKIQLPYCLPLAPPHNRTSYSSGIFVATATRDEFKEFENSSEW